MISTVHYGTIQYHYPELSIFSQERFDIEDKISAKVKELTASEVDENTDFRCQWEGRELQSESLPHLTKAHDRLLAYIKRFKHIKILE